jgi:hypothetical protein
VVRDLDLHADGAGQVLIRRGKTDTEGQGRAGKDGVSLARDGEVAQGACGYNRGAGISAADRSRPNWRRFTSGGSIAPIFKRVAQWIGMSARFVAEVSGHSTRIGAAQDLAELDIDLAAITQAGGWKSTRMPLQYAEKINAARSGMARAAAATGRDESVSERG